MYILALRPEGPNQFGTNGSEIGKFETPFRKFSFMFAKLSFSSANLIFVCAKLIWKRYNSDKWVFNKAIPITNIGNNSNIINIRR